MNARADMLTEERWLPVPGYEGAYSVSDFGRVRSEPRSVPYGNSMRSVAGRIKKASLHNGYLYVILYLNGEYSNEAVHRLVLLAFVGNPPAKSMQAAHGDGKPANCRLSNLRWATPKENMADRVIHGTANRGERHGLSKLTTSSVLAIRVDPRPQSLIALQHGVDRSTIGRIKNKTDWSWL